MRDIKLVDKKINSSSCRMYLEILQIIPKRLQKILPDKVFLRDFKIQFSEKGVSYIVVLVNNNGKEKTKEITFALRSIDSYTEYIQAYKKVYKTIVKSSYELGAQ